MPKRERTVEVCIDETALQACDACGFVAKAWPDTLPRVLCLRADVEALHAAHPERNFFLTWRAAQRLLAAAERPSLLGYIAEILEHYLPPPADRERSGAEFWVQRRGAGEGIAFHWDKDEALRDAGDVLLHPAVSTVTYLTDGGAPTVVLDVRALAEGGSVADGAELAVGARRSALVPGGAARRASALVSYPRAGKLLAFSGALLHGVPPALAEPSAVHGERLTLLVNVWANHRPLCTTPLPRSFTSRELHVSTERALPASGRSSTAEKRARARARPPGAAPPGGGDLPASDLPSLLSELRLPVIGDGQELRVLLHECTSHSYGAEADLAVEPGRGATTGGRGVRGRGASPSPHGVRGSSLRLFGVPVISHEIGGSSDGESGAH